jgi:hypothetical protein
MCVLQLLLIGACAADSGCPEKKKADLVDAKKCSGIEKKSSGAAKKKKRNGTCHAIN